MALKVNASESLNSAQLSLFDLSFKKVAHMRVSLAFLSFLNKGFIFIHRGSTFDRRLQARIQEMETDDKDRQREMEEIEEIRKRLGDRAVESEEEELMVCENISFNSPIRVIFIDLFILIFGKLEFKSARLSVKKISCCLDTQGTNYSVLKI